MNNNRLLLRDAVVVLAAYLAVCVLVIWLNGCANIFALESSVNKETRKTRERCEAAAKAGKDTTQVCRIHLPPKTNDTARALVP